MTAPVIFLPGPWVDLPSQDTPITAARLLRFENAIADIAAALSAIASAGLTGRQLLATSTPEQARGVIGAAAAGDIAGKVTNLADVTGVMWLSSTPTAASLMAAGITAKTLVAFPGGFSYFTGSALVPIGLSSGSAPVQSAGLGGMGTLSVTARVVTNQPRAGQLLAEGFLTVTGTISGGTGAAGAMSGGGTLAVLVQVGSYSGVYNDTYNDTYGA